MDSASSKELKYYSSCFVTGHTFLKNSELYPSIPEALSSSIKIVVLPIYLGQLLVHISQFSVRWFSTGPLIIITLSTVEL